MVLWDIIHCGRKGTRMRMWYNWSHFVPSQEAGREECLSLLPHVVLVIQPGTPALGVVRPAVRVGGFSSVKPVGLDPPPPLSHYHLPVSPLGTTKLSIVNVHLFSLIKCT